MSIRRTSLFTLVFFTFAAACSAAESQKAKGANDPLSIRIESSDAKRFAQLFEQTNGKPTAQQLKSGYLDKAGTGVKIFTPYRIENAENLEKAVRANPERYRYAIKTCLPLIEDLNKDMQSVYLAYRGLLPEKNLPAVYVVFGADNSGGTANAEAQVLGLEVMCGPGTTPAQFKKAMRNIFAHETVHSWQSDMTEESHRDPLLAAAFREGVPDFLSSLVTGQPPSEEKDIWGRQREKQLWTEFTQDRKKVQAGQSGPWKFDATANAAFSRWFGNYGNAPEGWPIEAGYWVGMRIAKAYYDKASDKRRAIQTLIDAKHPADLLRESGYKGGD
jgi:hypothetical protein